MVALSNHGGLVDPVVRTVRPRADVGSRQLPGQGAPHGHPGLGGAGRVGTRSRLNYGPAGWTADRGDIDGGRRFIRDARRSGRAHAQSVSARIWHSTWNADRVTAGRASRFAEAGLPGWCGPVATGHLGAIWQSARCPVWGDHRASTDLGAWGRARTIARAVSSQAHGPIRPGREADYGRAGQGHQHRRSGREHA